MKIRPKPAVFSPCRLYVAVELAIVTVLLWSTAAFCGEIHDAAKNGDVAKIKALITGNPSLVFSTDNDDLSPLHYATSAILRHKSVEKLLRQHGGHK